MSRWDRPLTGLLDSKLQTQKKQLQRSSKVVGPLLYLFRSIKKKRGK